MITPEQHAEIRRLYFGEHWKVGTIAAALGVHHGTVRAAIAHDTRALPRGLCRPTQLDRYLPFVRDTLAQYPRLRATRLFEMVRARGYPGSVVQLRRVVRTLRPSVTPTLYRRLTTLPAEEAQIDWGAFGMIRIGHGTRPLSGFVMVLSYSRALSALFTLDQTLERQIQYLRDAFFAARTFADVDDLNAQFRRWREEIAHQRPHPEQRDQTVAQVFAQEQPRLLPLPAHPFDTEVLRAVVSGKTPYVHFDRNSYSIPHTHVRRPLTLLASATTVRLVAGAEEIARHARSYDTGQTIGDLAHLEGLLAVTRQANPSSGRDRLRVAVPLIATLLEHLAARGESLRVHTARLLALLDDYGPQELTAAVADALARGLARVPSRTSSNRRRQRGQKPPIPLALPDPPGVRDLDVTPHPLESYDDLARPDPDDPE